MVAVKFFPHDSDYPMIYPIELAIFSWHFPEKSLENEETYGYIHLYPNDSPLFSGDDGHYIHNGVPTSTILMRLLSHILLLMIHFYYYPFLLLQKIMRKPTKYPFISLLVPYSHPCISHYSHIFTRLYPIIPINKSLISQDSPVFSSIFRRLYGNHGCFYMFLW